MPDAAIPVPMVRSLGRADLSVRPRGVGTGIARLRTSGCLKFLFPSGSDPLTGVLLNTSGGVTGGDRLALSIEAESGSNLTLTTQAAERIYRATTDTAQIANRLTVGDDARLNWLPQETILFNASDLTRTLTANVTGSGRLLIAEPVVFGRKLSGETLGRIAYRDRVELYRDGTPVMIDSTALVGDAQTLLARAAIAGGAGATALLTLVGPDADSLLDAVRDALTGRGAASLPRSGVLIARILADDGYDLRRTLAAALAVLAPDGVPPSWRL